MYWMIVDFAKLLFHSHDVLYTVRANPFLMTRTV